MKQKMYLLDTNNIEIECDVIAMWEDNNIKYVAYTDGTIKDDKLEIMVSRYSLENGNYKLEDIISDIEFDKVNKFLDDYLFSQDGENHGK